MDQIQSLLDKADPFATWWPFVVALLVGFVMTVRTLMGGQRCPTTNRIDKQIVIVTGGSHGIGLAITRALVERSGHVIVACKDIEKASKAIKILQREIRCGSGVGFGSRMEIRCLDLRSFDSVRRFARDFMASYDHLDILINNAGVIFHPDEKTADHFEIHLQVNYLAPFLLTHLLLPHLQKSEQGRIVNVSAHAHAAGKMSVDDPLNIGTWSERLHAREAFAHSKLAVLLGTRQLAKELAGTSITANVCTPGLVRGTGHLRRSPIMSAVCVRVITFPWMWLLMKNPFEGAQCAIYLATDPKLKTVSGEYFNDCEKAEPCELARNDELAKRLYAQTMRVLKLDTDVARQRPNRSLLS